MNSKIANILLPSPQWVSYSRLFVRINTAQVVNIGGKYIQAKIYRFNTWMNAFAANKYYKYCDLGEIFLYLHIKGKYHLQIIGSYSNYEYEYYDHIIVDKYINEDISEIGIPGAKEYEALYFIIYEDINEKIEFISGAWTTNKEQVRKSKIAIVCCTYKRENYVNKIIEDYENFINNRKEFKEKIKLFIIDNGKTLNINRSNELTAIIHNKNTGGAGGFTRGLLEVCKLNEKFEENKMFTRVLFMDDDIEILPEAYYRTLIISDYLKEQYSDSFINGAMLEMEYKHIFVENLAFQDKLWVKRDITDINIYNYYNVMVTNKRKDNIFYNKNIRVDSAWWYCCFTINKETKNKLPLPIFYRGDDVEWSWRNFGKHHISFNGINVWHSIFRFRISILGEMYYLPRNMFIINSLYTTDYYKKFEQHFKDIFNYRLENYDYSAIEIFNKSLNDILKGSSIFLEDPEMQNIRISKNMTKLEYFDANEEEMDYAKNFVPESGKLRKLLYFLTKKGKYWPNFLFTDESIAVEYLPYMESFRLRNNVKVYNFLTGKYSIRSINRKKAAYLEKEFNILLKKIKKNYMNLKKSYESSYKELTSYDFWIKYLELKE